MYGYVSQWVTDWESVEAYALLPRIPLTLSYKWTEDRGDTKNNLVLLLILTRMVIYYRTQLSWFGYYLYHLELGLLSKGLQLYMWSSNSSSITGINSKMACNLPYGFCEKSISLNLGVKPLMLYASWVADLLISLHYTTRTSGLHNKTGILLAAD